MRSRLITGFVAIVATATAVACADAPSGPSARPTPAVAALAKGGNGNGNAYGIVGKTTGNGSSSSDDSVVAYLSTLHDTLSRATGPVVGMRRLVPLKSVQTASASIGALGGVVELPGAGATLWVPPGAVSKTTTFTITAKPGKQVAYEFAPAGAVFSIPLVLFQDRTLLGAFAPAGFNSPALGYLGSSANIDPTTANGVASQMRFPLSLSTPQSAAFPIWHFSGYIVAWGVRGGDER